MNPQDCVYTELTNGIHEFVYMTDSKDGVDAMIAQIEALFETHSLDDTLRFIIDFHKPQKPPTLYAFQQGVMLFQRHPQHPYMRTAYIHRRGFVVSTVKMYTSILRQDTKNERHFFLDNEREAAIDWLLD